MAGNYPDSLPAYSTKKFVNNVTEIIATNYNYWYNEVLSIATELGIEVKGVATDLVTRLAISLTDAGKLKLLQICTSATRPDPGTEGMIIYETDTNDFFGCVVGGAAPTWRGLAKLEDVQDAIDKAHTQNTDTHLGTVDQDIPMNTHKFTELSVPDNTGQSVRTTAKITEVNLESAVDLKHDGSVQANTAQTGWIVVSVKGIRGEYSGNVHIEITRSANADYSTPGVEVDSAVSQTGLYAHIGDSWVAFPSGGIPIDTEEVAYQSTYNIGTRYYLKARLKYDSTYGEWFYTVGSGGRQKIGQGVRNYEDLFNKPANIKKVAIEFIIDGGGLVIPAGIKGDLEIPFACTIKRATLLADQSGSIVIDIWKDAYANFPPTDADSITASAPPTITTATKSQDSTLTDWTKAITAGDILRFNVDSITDIQRVTVSLYVEK